MSSRSRLWLGVIGAVAFVSSLSPIVSWDYFWHLATGRWILDNSAIPATDPFSAGSEPVRWINGAWLFQVIIALINGAAGHTGVWFTRAIATAVVFMLVYREAERRCGPACAALLTALGIWGAWHRLDSRPETAGVFCAVVAVIILQRMPRFAAVLYLLLTVAWFNLHPSALLSPLLAGAALVASLREPAERLRRLGVLAAAAGGLLVNPWVLEGVLAPFRLAGQVESGGFVNLEWLPSRPQDFPLLYLCVVVLVVLIVRDRLRHPFEAIVTIALAVLAMRWVRNHAFFFVLLPLLAAPLVAHLAVAREKLDRVIAILAAVLCLGALSNLLVSGVRPGFDRERFPVRSAAMIEHLSLSGNVYTPDQFGGFLIWSLYPERRVLIDGRNELYVRLIPRILEARRDSREWQRLFADYDLTIAVEEHAREPLEIVNPATGQSSYRSPSLAYFPRERWALLAVDPASMLFVRRDAVDPRILQKFEYREWRPDIVDPSVEVRDVRRWQMESVRGESELMR